ncbi:hypothetical protein [Falsiroseomonas sp. CW058]|uniref:hypothetical protein n=1 Tax=Falsiroseomonas sp. CW058 TaxID=3388664 RepID=UPI003D321B51
MTEAPSPAPVAATAQDVRGWCDLAGMRADSPLRAALLATVEAASTAREAADGVRRLTPEGEAALVKRVAEAAAAGAEREVERLARRVELRTVVALAASGIVLLCSGYALGRWDAGGMGAARGGVSFLAQVAELNDAAALRRHCERTAYEQGGRRACSLPSVWIGAHSP